MSQSSLFEWFLRWGVHASHLIGVWLTAHTQQQQQQPQKDQIILAVKRKQFSTKSSFNKVRHECQHVFHQITIQIKRRNPIAFQTSLYNFVGCSLANVHAINSTEMKWIKEKKNTSEREISCTKILEIIAIHSNRLNF